MEATGGNFKPLDQNRFNRRRRRQRPEPRAEESGPPRLVHTCEPMIRGAARAAVRVMIIDHHIAYRQALRKILAAAVDMEVVAEAETVSDALEGLRCDPDVILLDIDVSDGDKPSAINVLRSNAPTTQVIVMSGLSCRDPEHMRDLAIARGAHAYVHKSDKLLPTIRAAIGSWAADPIPTALVVDNDFSVLLLARRMMRRWNVSIASDGATALVRTCRLEPDVIVIENQLPDVSGVDLIPTLLGLSPKSKVILMSSVKGSVKVKALRSYAWERGACMFAAKQDLPQIRRLAELVLRSRPRV